MQLFISDSLTTEQAEELVRDYIDQHRHKMLTILRAQDPQTYRKVAKQKQSNQTVSLANNIQLITMLSHTLLSSYGFYPNADVIFRPNMLLYVLRSIRVDKDSDGSPLQVLATIERIAESGAGDFALDVRTVLITELISMSTGDTVSMVDVNLV
ncbi:hypothetical protein [Pseudomonas rhodesiae]|uniref:hypothetical protein n=1 Tax=Pseudomonas rhodesiae TaxID=76760 RepID=UPI00209DF3BA|nr:hypothetical protein [Pseudomonas rhodesiae]MCP1515622.1 hypothetical protein [Pseudomonas rhodesiae]MDF9773026.1 hypothetical protein [Pseudomonas rhodesiae]